MQTPPVVLLIGIGIVTFIAGIILHWLLSKNTLKTAYSQLSELLALRDENTYLKMENTRLIEVNRSESEKLTWSIASEQRLATSFEALASKVLLSNSEQLISANNEKLSNIVTQINTGWVAHQHQMQGMVGPIATDMTKIDLYVRELESKREGAYKELSTQLVQLAEQQNELRKTTSTLSGALRSTTIRGQWGEIQLRRVVELAGMKAHVDFQEQVSTDDGRPDMVVLMPNQGALALDAKTPMSAYLEAMETTDEVVRRQKLLEHANAVQGRINELSSKQYWNGIGHTPELVVMFIPNEACLASAFETRPALLDMAMEKKVLIVSPTTLLALLKAIAYGWQQYEVSVNAQKIAAEAKDLYKRMQVFVQHYSKLGTSLSSTVTAYNASVGSFESRLASSVERLQRLGVGSEPIKFPQALEITARPMSTVAIVDEFNIEANELLAVSA